MAATLEADIHSADIHGTGGDSPGGDGPTRTTPTDFEAKVRRLVKASERSSHDPFVEIDWPEQIDDSEGWLLPPDYLPLFGTSVWEAMSDSERRADSRHECAALCSAGMWFENILMHLVLRHLYDMPADDPTNRYLLIETADECRHSAMFGELIRRSGTPAYQVPRWLRFSGRWLKATAGRADAYIAILVAEELLDMSNRATMKDERVAPVSRAVARLHVVEEARHMGFARALLTEQWPTLSVFERGWAAVFAPIHAWFIARALVNPAVYRELGIADGARLARSNPHQRERVTRDLGRLEEFLTGLGAVTPLTRPIWKLLRLV